MVPKALPGLVRCSSDSTVAALKARGVEFTAPIADHRYGFVTHFKAPGNFQIQLYQPKYGK